MNPAHLEVGTHRDNMRDMRERGRAATGDRNAAWLYPEKRATGERHGMARLTAAQVAEIRSNYVPFRVTQKMLAAEYGVSVPQIQHITQGRQWRNV